MTNFFETYRSGSRFNMMDRFDRMGFLGIYGWAFGLLILTLVVVGIIFLIRAIVRSSRKPSDNVPPSNVYDAAPPSITNGPSAFMMTNPALKILDERLARGEIDTDEYRRIKDELLRP